MPRSDAEATDEELVGRIRSGDEGAAQELFSRYFPLLRARLKRRMFPSLRSKSGESDVIQEAYMVAYLRLAEFEDRGEGSFGRWLRGIVDHKLNETIRRHVGTEKRDVRREQAPPEGESPPSATSGEGTPSSAAMATEEVLSLARAIDGMPEQYRTVLRLLYQQRLPLKEAGALMGRLPDAVRMLYARALAALSESLHRDGSAGPR